jgi:creatinine amidohydrolase
MNTPGIILADLTWVEAEPILAAGPLVVLPLGAGAKEHGPHLRLDNDRRTVEYLAERLRERLPIVVAPTITFHHYPAFVEYPGSISLRLETARDLVVDICRSLAAFGPRRFYVLNYGVSTIRALAPAAALLAGDGILLRYTVLAELLGPIEDPLLEQPEGTHADEGETSLMLKIAPERVNMALAARDIGATGSPGPLRRAPRRDPSLPGRYSPTGIYGDATLATRAKGAAILPAFLDALAAEIAGVGREALPGERLVPSRDG